MIRSGCPIEGYTEKLKQVCWLHTSSKKTKTNFETETQQYKVNMDPYLLLTTEAVKNDSK